LKSALLLNIFFAIGIFLLLVFLLRYFVVKYRGRKKLYKQVEHMQSQATRLGHHILAQKIGESQGKELVVFFIEYLERFTTNMPYASVPQLLAQHGFDQEEIDSLLKVLYKGGHLQETLKTKILHMM